MSRAKVHLPVLLVCALALFSACAPAAGEQASTKAPVGPTAAEVRAVDVAHNAEVAANVKVLQTAQWYKAAYEADVARYLEAAAAAEAEAAARAAQAAARAAAEARWAAAHRQRPTVPQAPRAAPQRPTGGGSGACGGATNGADHVIPAESGGRADALGPQTSSGQAWGCYQIMAGTWKGAGCSGTWGSASAQEQAACASKLGPSNWPTW